ncbi:MAG TPA: 1-deoxy-D-xylulose-5-phosphate reductoisomerase, partial [bacterium]
MKRLIILGSTGSIGRQALEIVDAFPGEFQVVGLGARRNAGMLAEQARRYQPRAVALVDEGAADALRDVLPAGVTLFTGTDALRSAARIDGDVVLVAVVGVAGLLPTLDALHSGHDVALANKETLV